MPDGPRIRKIKVRIRKQRMQRESERVRKRNKKFEELNRKESGSVSTTTQRVESNSRGTRNSN